MRQIPGSKEVFDVFRRQDFEVQLSQLGKSFSSEMFVTNQGYDAFKTTVTAPNKEVHIVINTPVAYWLVAEEDLEAFQKVYQSFRKFQQDEVVEVKKAVSGQESFVGDLQSARYVQAASKMSESLRAEFSEESLRLTFEPVASRLSRKLRVFSVQTDGQKAVVRSTLEDKSSNKYTFVDIKLIQESGTWKVDLFALGEDSDGLPYEMAMKNIQKEVKKEDLLKN